MDSLQQPDVDYWEVSFETEPDACDCDRSGDRNRKIDGFCLGAEITPANCKQRTQQRKLSQNSPYKHHLHVCDTRACLFAKTPSRQCEIYYVHLKLRLPQACTRLGSSAPIPRNLSTRTNSLIRLRKCTYLPAAGDRPYRIRLQHPGFLSTIEHCRCCGIIISASYHPLLLYRSIAIITIFWAVTLKNYIFFKFSGTHLRLKPN